MRVAFISFEAPPDTLVGGIGTYVGHAAQMLVARGHEVEVFAASPQQAGTVEVGGYLTHLFQLGLTVKGRAAFPALAGPAFAARHASKPFDVLEGPEFLAEAAVARKLVPDVPLVVRLHMSMTFIRQINRPPPSLLERFKAPVRNALQPVLRLERWRQFDFAALEGPHLLEADEISAPCREIADITARMWKLDRTQMTEVPYPFAPSLRLLEIPVETTTNTVGYIGRLETRKGVVDLAQAVPLILKRFPDARFLFAGGSEGSPTPGVEMSQYLEAMLAPHRERITFLGRVPHAQMADVLRRVDVVVLPSLWENFPNACLEAMAAGRGVVGSAAGGMAEQLDGGRVGLLIRPQQPREIADAVCRLLADPPLRMTLGHKARARVLDAYNADRIGEQTEQSYQRAIFYHQNGGRRWRAC